MYDVRTRGGRGSGKSRQKEQNQLIYVRDRGRGSTNPKVYADIIYGSPLTNSHLGTLARARNSGHFQDHDPGRGRRLSLRVHRSKNACQRGFLSYPNI